MANQKIRHRAAMKRFDYRAGRRLFVDMRDDDGRFRPELPETPLS